MIGSPLVQRLLRISRFAHCLGGQRNCRCRAITKGTNRRRPLALPRRGATKRRSSRGRRVPATDVRPHSSGNIRRCHVIAMPPLVRRRVSVIIRDNRPSIRCHVIATGRSVHSFVCPRDSDTTTCNSSRRRAVTRNTDRLRAILLRRHVIPTGCHRPPRCRPSF